jgi:hypothetical protein
VDALDAFDAFDALDVLDTSIFGNFLCHHVCVRHARSGPDNVFERLFAIMTA